jgi:hypothetical protein
VTEESLRADLDRLVAGAAAGELCAIIGTLEAAKAAAWARVIGSAVPKENHQADAVPERLLTPEEAAAIAAVPTRRIYSWAHGTRWAHRPSRKCLRISEGAFRRWLATRNR